MRSPIPAAASIESHAVTTDGYFIVPERIRGSIDRPANVRFAAVKKVSETVRGAGLPADVFPELQPDAEGVGE